MKKNGWEVICFEPNPKIINETKSQRKVVLEIALTNENKPVEFSVVTNMDSMAGMTSIHVSPEQKERYKNTIQSIDKVTVQGRTLDSVLSDELKHLDHINMMSVDVEEEEYNLYQGFNLKKWMPKIMLIENSFNKNNFSEYIQGFGYKLELKLNADEFYVRL